MIGYLAVFCKIRRKQQFIFILRKTSFCYFHIAGSKNAFFDTKDLDIGTIGVFRGIVFCQTYGLCTVNVPDIAVCFYLPDSFLIKFTEKTDVIITVHLYHCLYVRLPCTGGNTCNNSDQGEGQNDTNNRNDCPCFVHFQVFQRELS